MSIEIALVLAVIAGPIVWGAVLLVNALIHDARQRRQIAAACRRIAAQRGHTEPSAGRHRRPERLRPAA